MLPSSSRAFLACFVPAHQGVAEAAEVKPYWAAVEWKVRSRSFLAAAAVRAGARIHGKPPRAFWWRT